MADLIQPHRPALASAAPRRSGRHAVMQVCVVMAALLLGAGSGAAQAQVNRCIDAAGQVQYTDAACPKGARAAQIEAPRTAEQIEADRLRAEEARQRNAERQQLREREMQLEIERLEAERRLQAERAAAQAIAAPRTGGHANSAACRDAHAALEAATLDHGRYSSEERARLLAAQDQVDRACLDPASYAAIQRNRAAQQVSPIIVVPRRPPYPGNHGWPGSGGWYAPPPPRPQPPGGQRPPAPPRPPQTNAPVIFPNIKPPVPVQAPGAGPQDDLLPRR
ncbi:uncharacterized protein DUF4124 [Corticibacter populi]|nr:uncharacterized protein DUF4124 [Corticibacter populi]